MKDLIYQYLAGEYPYPAEPQPSGPAKADPPLQNTPSPAPPKAKAAKPVSSQGHLGVPAHPELLTLYEECLQNLRTPLAESATNLVFGAGNPEADIMLIGEAPGADEDEQGLPFVGRSGRYMTDVFEKLGVKRDDLYIANILKHRPPNNRDPLPAEMEVYTPYLIKQIAIVRPKLLVTAGNFASKFILQTETGITKLRGQVHESSYGKVFPILHPAAIIRGAYPKEMFEGDIAKAIEAAQNL